MAGVGIGVGDIIMACNFIYTTCQRYKDAPDDFNEIATKAKSTAVVLERLDVEAKAVGNLAERAGPQAYEQLEGNLNSLRNDSTKLKSLVEKYNKMHAEGPGRRLLWSLMESSNLTDLRRRIGYHEQTLQLWYMTLVYGSLRRLEGGQEDIIAAIKSIRNEDLRKVSASLLIGDSKPLKRELRQKGISVDEIEANIGTAIDYITAPPIEKLRMESQVGSPSYGDRRRHSSRTERPFHYDWPPVDSEIPVEHKLPPSTLKVRNSGRSSSTSAGPRYRHLEDSEVQVQPESNSQKRRPGIVTINVEPRERERRASETLGSRAPTKTVLIEHDWPPVDSEIPVEHKLPPSTLKVRNSGRSSSTSAGPKYRHLEDSEVQVQPESNSQKRRPGIVTINVEPRERERRASESLGSRAPTKTVLIEHDSSLSNPPPTSISHHRSKSGRRRDRSSSDTGRDREEQPSIIVVEHRGGRSKDRQEDENKRDPSTHSYVRRRRRSSVESAGREKDKDIPRIVHVMNRIDSIPVDTE